MGRGLLRCGPEGSGQQAERSNEGHGRDGIQPGAMKDERKNGDQYSGKDEKNSKHATCKGPGHPSQSRRRIKLECIPTRD